MSIFLGAVNDATQSSEEFTSKLARQRTMSESWVSKGSAQPSSNLPVQVPVLPSGNSSSTGAKEELAAVLARRRKWETLPRTRHTAKDEVSNSSFTYQGRMCYTGYPYLFWGGGFQGVWQYIFTIHFLLK